MKQNIGLLAMDWYVRRTAFGDGIRRSCDILVLLIFRIGLMGIGFDSLDERQYENGAIELFAH